MFDSADARQEGFWRVGIARNALFFHSFVASRVRKGSSEKRELRRIGCPRCRQNRHHACARKQFLRKKGTTLRVRSTFAREQFLRKKGTAQFLKLSFAKIAPRLRARTIWKSKSLKTGGVGALLEVELTKICATPARESNFCEKKAPGCMFGGLLEVELLDVFKICTTPAREIPRDRFGSQNR